MGYQIIRQSDDGQYCLWSSYVDDVVVCDATRDEVLRFFIDLETQSTRDRVSRVLDQVDEAADEGAARSKAYAQFTIPYERVRDRVERLRTDPEAEAL